MSRRFFSGRTLQAAVLAAASYYDLESEELAYEEIDKRHGFLKSRGKVVIAVDPAEPRRRGSPTPEDKAAAKREAKAAPAREEPPERPDGEREEAREEAAPEAAPDEAPSEAGETEARTDEPESEAEDEAAGEDTDEPAPARSRRARAGAEERSRAPRGGSKRGARRAEDAAADGAGDELVELPDQPRALRDRYRPAEGPLADAAGSATTVIAAVAGLDLEATVLEGDERLEVDLSGAHELLTAEDGELLVAIEHLLPRVMRGFGDETAAVRVDSENFQEIREERLRSYAQQVASEVRKSGRGRTLDPLSPSDRRIVHLTVTDEPGVESESQGSGFLKRVRITAA